MQVGTSLPTINRLVHVDSNYYETYLMMLDLRASLKSDLGL